MNPSTPTHTPHPSANSSLQTENGHWLSIRWPQGMNADTARTLDRFVAELTALVHELGPQGALTNICQSRGSFDESSAKPIVTIIPSAGQPSACTPIVIAVGSGKGPALPRPGRAPQGLRGVCRTLRHHLIACFGITEAAVVVTDVWDPQLIQESLDDFRAHAQRGVHFTILLVHNGGVAAVSAGL